MKGCEEMTQVKCENCGTMNNISNEYCVYCREKLRYRITLEKIDKKAWDDFVDFKHERYFKVFSLHKHKKLFANLNWSAGFFGFRWAMYRKMYKLAIVGLLVATLLTAITVVITFSAHEQELTQLEQIVNASKSEFEAMRESGEIYKATIKSRYDASVEVVKLYMKILLISLWPSVLANMLFFLFGDSFYKMYVKKNINTPRKGGTNIWAGLFWIELISKGCAIIIAPIYLIFL